MDTCSRLKAPFGRVCDSQTFSIQRRDTRGKIARFSNNGGTFGCVGDLSQPGLYEALQTVYSMHLQGMPVSGDTFHRLLQGCTKMKDLDAGRRIHSLMIASGLDSASLLGDYLIRLFASCPSLLEPSMVFCSIEKPTVYTWHAIILAHTSFGEGRKAIEFYHKMEQDGIQADKVVFLCILKACCSINALLQGKLIHAQIIRRELEVDMVIGCTLVDMYAKCGNQKEASKVFENLPSRDVVAWNAMIAGYAQHGHSFPALRLFCRMQQEGMEPDKVTFLSIMKGCASTGSIEQGKLIHGQIIIKRLESDVAVGTTLINMYAKCESIEEARRVFDKLPNRNELSWNAMIAGYAQHGHYTVALEMFEKMREECMKQNISSWNTLIAGYAQHGHCHSALELFEHMQQEGIKPDKVTFLCILKACGSIEALAYGKLIHNQIIKSVLISDVAVGNTLIDMYAKCGSLEDSHRVFDYLPNLDLVSWNAMIVAYAQHGDGYLALEFFERMQREGIKPDKVTLSCILKACASVGALGQGKSIHGHIIERRFQSDMVIESTLVDMYARCGNLEDARKVFDALPNRDLASWNAMITGYAHHGHCWLANQCIAEMKQQGLKPSNRTYTSILAACSHAGQLEEGCHYFKSMREDHGITPGIQHFNCMVDLLGHAGLLNEAKELLHSIPVLPDVTSWLSLLSACRRYSNKELAKGCFDQVVQLDPDIAAGYVLMASIYANTDLWNDASRIQELMQCAEAWKKPGTAWIEINNNIHEFIVGRETHQNRDDICAKSKNLGRLLREVEYVPQLGLVLDLNSELGKDNDLYREALGILNNLEGINVPDTNNFQVCNYNQNGKIVLEIVKRPVSTGDSHSGILPTPSTPASTPAFALLVRNSFAASDGLDDMDQEFAPSSNGEPIMGFPVSYGVGSLSHEYPSLSQVYSKKGVSSHGGF